MQLTRWYRDDDLRQDMLDLHGMAHNLINQDYSSGTRRDESIGELAERLTGDILECIAHLEQAYQAVSALRRLAAAPSPSHSSSKCSLNVDPRYWVRNRPRRCSSGTTRSTNSSKQPGV